MRGQKNKTFQQEPRGRFSVHLLRTEYRHVPDWPVYTWHTPLHYPHGAKTKQTGRVILVSSGRAGRHCDQLQKKAKKRPNCRRPSKRKPTTRLNIEREQKWARTDRVRGGKVHEKPAKTGLQVLPPSRNWTTPFCRWVRSFITPLYRPPKQQGQTQRRQARARTRPLNWTRRQQGLRTD